MLRHSSHQKISGLLEQADIEALLNISHISVSAMNADRYI